MHSFLGYQWDSTSEMIPPRLFSARAWFSVPTIGLPMLAAANPLRGLTSANVVEHVWPKRAFGGQLW